MPRLGALFDSCKGNSKQPVGENPVKASLYTVSSVDGKTMYTTDIMPSQVKKVLECGAGNVEFAYKDPTKGSIIFGTMNIGAQGSVFVQKLEVTRVENDDHKVSYPKIEASTLIIPPHEQHNNVDSKQKPFENRAQQQEPQGVQQQPSTAQNLSENQKSAQTDLKMLESMDESQMNILIPCDKRWIMRSKHFKILLQVRLVTSSLAFKFRGPSHSD